VVFSSGGQSFGKLDTHLKVDSYDGKHLVLSDLALSKEAYPISEITGGLDADLVAGYVPLVTNGLQIVPAADDRFQRNTATALVYLEIYEPLLAGSNPPKIVVDMKVVDNAGRTKIRIGVTETESLIQPGNPVVPIGLWVPVNRLEPGSYRLEVRAVDSAGNASPTRSTEFAVD
jgi:hypothetical protein